MAANETFASFGACEAACLPKPPPPPPPPMQVGELEVNTDIDGVRAGSDAAPKSWKECKASCAKATGCDAFVFDNRTVCTEARPSTDYPYTDLQN